MKKVMFVCHGNICRSPMAEFLFKKMVKDISILMSELAPESIINSLSEKRQVEN